MVNGVCICAYSEVAFSHQCITTKDISREKIFMAY